MKNLSECLLLHISLAMSYALLCVISQVMLLWKGFLWPRCSKYASFQVSAALFYVRTVTFVRHGSVQMIRGLLACKQRSAKLPQSKHWSGSCWVCRTCSAAPVVQRCLNSSTIPVQVRTLDPTGDTVSSLCPCFVLLANWGPRGSRESCIVPANKQTCSLIASTAFIGCSMWISYY